MFKAMLKLLYKIVPIILLTTSPSVFANGKFLVGDFSPGPYKVGFKVFHEKDYSRNYFTNVESNTNKPINEFKPYPMQIGVWYPAEAVQGNPMKFKDYVDLTITRDGLEFKNNERAIFVSDSIYKRRSFVGTLDTAKLESFLNLETTAYLNAKQTGGKFPVIIYGSPVSDGVYNNSVLCEYLASHGYIVAATPPKNGVLQSFYEQVVRDMQYVKGFMNKFRNTDMGKVGVIGYQNFPAAGFAQTDYSISAYVDLRGTIGGSNNFVNQLRQAYNYLDSRALRVPLLIIDGTNYQLQKDNIQAEYDKMLYTDVYHFNYKDAIPLSYASEWMLRWVKALDNPNQGMFIEKEMSEKAYNSTVKNTLKFLNAYVKGDQHALADLKSTKDGEYYTFTSREAAPIPPTGQQFQAVLQNQNADEALRIWEKVKAIDPGYKIMAGSGFMNFWGYQLISQGSSADAVKVFEMMLEDFPNDPNLWDSAGEGYFANGQKEKAAEALKKSLAWNPPAPQATIDNSISLLRQLGYNVTDNGKIAEGKSATVNPKDLKQPFGSREADEKYGGRQPFNDPTRLSENKVVSKKIGDLTIKIEYGAPKVKSRKLVGGMIPTYRAWRTGANEATVITFDKPVKVEGEWLPAGSYALFSVGGENEWTIILNTEFQQWGAFAYNANKDVMRFKVKPQKGEHQEEMKFEFSDVRNNSGKVVLRWGEIAVPIKVETTS